MCVCVPSITVIFVTLPHLRCMVIFINRIMDLATDLGIIVL